MDAFRLGEEFRRPTGWLLSSPTALVVCARNWRLGSNPAQIVLLEVTINLLFMMTHVYKNLRQCSKSAKLFSTFLLLYGTLLLATFAWAQNEELW